jgi:hypothetical protein
MTVLDAAPFAPVDQEYLVDARQMQALSFAVHIPIVCFGIAFPAFVLFLEGLWLRSGDPVRPSADADLRRRAVAGDRGPRLLTCVAVASVALAAAAAANDHHDETRRG